MLSRITGAWFSGSLQIPTDRAVVVLGRVYPISAGTRLGESLPPSPRIFGRNAFLPRERAAPAQTNTCPTFTARLGGGCRVWLCLALFGNNLWICLPLPRFGSATAKVASSRLFLRNVPVWFSCPASPRSMEHELDPTLATDFDIGRDRAGLRRPELVPCGIQILDAEGQNGDAGYGFLNSALPG